MVGVFDLSVPGKATFQKVIQTFGEMFYAIQYDSVRDTVWLVTANSRTHNTVCAGACVCVRVRVRWCVSVCV
jgi:hypothetical protein